MFTAKDLPPDWRTEPPPPFTKAIGDDWVKAARSAVFALPSVITGETNYLLNPAHPDFKKISIGKPERFVFDPRLLSLKIGDEVTAHFERFVICIIRHRS